jgi:uncharacterized protein (TIGR03086 family)
MPTQGVEAPSSDSELLRRIEQALDTNRALLRGASVDQWPQTTPCREWNVGQLVGHMIEGVGSFARIMDNEPFSAHAPASDPAVAAAMFEAAARATMQSLSRSGALERTYHPPWGDTQGRTMAEFLLIESVVHGWDLARATGQPPAFTDETAALAHLLSRASLATSPREPAFFGPEILLDGDHSELDSLVALLGRDPR